MKKLLTRTFLWLLLCLTLTSTAVLLAPYDKKFGYQFIQGAGIEKVQWVYCRIFEDPTPIDVAIMGTSRTYFGVNDTLISDTLSARTGRPVHAVNLSFYGRSRNQHLFMLEDMIGQGKRPKVLVLGVMEKELRRSHSLGGAMISTSQLGCIIHPLNRRIVKDVTSFIEVRKGYTKYLLGMETEWHSCDPATPTFDARDTLLSAAELAEHQEKMNQILSPIYTDTTYWGWEFHYPLSLLRKIVKLCRENDIQIVFSYMPAYQGPEAPFPFFLDQYKAWGSVCLAPVEVLNDPTCWMDSDHYNKRGNEICSQALGQYLASIWDE
ncbi:MAG: hypothetical protein D6722_08445 [Bacteroidetes bacterium]|nr:MAG: hypothetical protein D6722_08445 [Bacteroidota bacterium]